jgi:hypothetical protein
MRQVRSTAAQERWKLSRFASSDLQFLAGLACTRVGGVLLAPVMRTQPTRTNFLISLRGRQSGWAPMIAWHNGRRMGLLINPRSSVADRTARVLAIFARPGLAAEALRRYLRLLTSRLSFQRVYAYVPAAFTDLVALHVAAGMQPEGLLRQRQWHEGEWLDIVVLGTEFLD